MTEIRNTDGKLVCRIDEKKWLIEIVSRGWLTKIRFMQDNSPDIKHYRLIRLGEKLKH